MGADEAPGVARLRLVPDQPVEGCELTPDVFLTNGISPSVARLEYHWYRSTDKMACSLCGKTPVIMQRLTDNSYYCSIGCFIAASPGPAPHHLHAGNARAPWPRAHWWGHGDLRLYINCAYYGSRPQRWPVA